MTSIYYFTGTGNSLAIVRELKKCLAGECDIISITTLVDFSFPSKKSDIIGFVFPVYFADAPDIMKKFIRNFDFNSVKYIFSVANCNSVPGIALYSVEKILREKGAVANLK